MKQILDVSALEELSREECLRLLGDHKVGRVAVADPGEAPLVVPVNYLLDGEAVVFRSGTGSKLRALAGTPISFQLDEVDLLHWSGWSVPGAGSRLRDDPVGDRPPGPRRVGTRRQTPLDPHHRRGDLGPAHPTSRSVRRPGGLPVIG